MYVKKTFKFEAAHRLVRHGGRCAGLHGHSYKVELRLNGEPRTEDGMIIDFGEVKELFGWIIDQFDHSLILDKEDIEKKDEDAFVALVKSLNPRYILLPCHPTAEMMAAYFYWWAVAIFGGMIVKDITVWETETSSATCDRILREVDFTETVFSEAVRAAIK